MGQTREGLGGGGGQIEGAAARPCIIAYPRSEGIHSLFVCLFLSFFL